MVHAQPSICPGESDTQNPMGFCHTNRSPNLGQTTRPCNIQHKKRELAELWVSDHTIKLKESKKKDKYLDLARELKKLWKMKVMKKL